MEKINRIVEILKTEIKHMNDYNRRKNINKRKR